MSRERDIQKKAQEWIQKEAQKQIQREAQKELQSVFERDEQEEPSLNKYNGNSYEQGFVKSEWGRRESQIIFQNKLNHVKMTEQVRESWYGVEEGENKGHLREDWDAEQFREKKVTQMSQINNKNPYQTQSKYEDQQNIQKQYVKQQVTQKKRASNLSVRSVLSKIHKKIVQPQKTGNQAKLQKPSIHLRSLIANITWAIAFMIFLPETIAGDVLALNGVGCFFVLLAFYAFYLVLGLVCNPMVQYVRTQNTEHGGKLQTEYDVVRAKKGHFTFFAECYHIQLKQKTIPVPTNNGLEMKKVTVPQKVVTHTARQVVFPADVQDDSGRLSPVLATKSTIFIHNIVSYRHKTKESAQNYQERWQHFKAENKKDKQQRYVDDYVIPDLKERMTFYVSQNRPNFTLFFWVFTICGLLWPYSIYVESLVCRYSINYMKIVTINKKTEHKK